LPRHAQSPHPKLLDQQSVETDIRKRKDLVWEIERKFAEDGARPVIFLRARCHLLATFVKGVTLAANSIFKHCRPPNPPGSQWAITRPKAHRF
jgi:hypothetical protein